MTLAYLDSMREKPWNGENRPFFGRMWSSDASAMKTCTNVFAASTADAGGGRRDMMPGQVRACQVQVLVRS